MGFRYIDHYNKSMNSNSDIKESFSSNDLSTSPSYDEEVYIHGN